MGRFRVKVLVTGATGFVGRFVLECLRTSGAEVHACARRAGARELAQWHEADLLTAGEPRALIDAVRPTHLLHLAWYSEPGTFWTSRENLRWLSATMELLEAFADAGGERFVGTGTCAEYDWGGSGICDEGSTMLRPATLYGATKLAAYDVLRTFAEAVHLSWAWARLFFMFGPNEPRQKLIASVITSLLRGEVAKCTSGEQRRDFLHVSDVGSALAALLMAEVDGAVNIGSGQPVAVRDVVTRIAALLGARDRLAVGAVMSARPEAPLVVSDSKRLNEEVGWQPVLTLEEGLQATIDWWRAELEE
jgi:nucleoside-diphosphate-sugar epimerase